jgi:hypothetical protein
MTLFRVTTTASQLGSLYNNVLHFEKPEAEEVDQVLLATHVNSWILSNPLALNHANSVTWTNIHVKAVDADFDPLDFPTFIGGSASTSISGNPFATAVIQLRTAHGGPRGRGRFHMPGFDHNNKENGLWSAFTQITGAAVAQALEDFWINEDNPNFKHTTFKWMVASRKQDELGTKFEVTKIRFRPYPGICRRRALGVGT